MQCANCGKDAGERPMRFGPIENWLCTECGIRALSAWLNDPRLPDVQAREQRLQEERMKQCPRP